MRLLIGAIICLLATLQEAVSQDCVETCPAGEEWNSNVTVVEQGQTFLTLEWEVDQPSTVYLVRWFQERVFIGNDNTTDLLYTISNLMSNTQYTVTICRQMVAVDNCGNCNLCATTLQGPPDPPGGVAIQVNGPDSILVIWQQLGGGEMVDMWHILCVVSDTGKIVHNSTRIALQITMFKNQDVFQLTPETTYNCSVAASNAFGLGEYSPIAQGITLARTIPGLVSDVRVFVYHPLSEETSLTGLVLWTPPAGST
ncbi:uncharacterized protein LOC135344649 isoform X2 [Halichondria panicea]|uniref:uncharacterized protein LOC135344649 isoform X2 n=1 Tax=Halichondria panicea TaxID=6063 RepID=UPI00312B9E7B